MRIMIMKYSKIFVIFAVLYSLAGCGGGGGSSSGGLTPETPVTPTDTSKYEAIAGVPSLSFGPPTINGTVVTFPLNVSKTEGKSIFGIEADIRFDSVEFALIMNGNTVSSAVAGAAATAADKRIEQFKSLTNSDVLHIAITDLGAKAPISDGVIANISFSLVQGAMPSSYAFILVPRGTDANGSVLLITGTH